MASNPSHPPFHGGDLSHAQAEFGEGEQAWLDLSTGINPNPYPDTTISPASLAKLPSNFDLSQLLATARSYYSVPAQAEICAGPGTQAILQALPHVVKHSHICVLGHTYGEHDHIWRETGSKTFVAHDLNETDAADVIIIVNPNNPDGRSIQPQELLALYKSLRKRNGILILDEAFVDTAPELSMAAHTGEPGLLVLRSFGKFFGLAGVRLGFAIGHQILVQALSHRLGPWAVSGPALEIGTRALCDDTWITNTRAQLKEKAQKLDDVILEAGLKIVGGTDLFRLIECDNAQKLYQNLGHCCIYTRKFSYQPHWLRVGLPQTQKDLTRLAVALKQR